MSAAELFHDDDDDNDADTDTKNDDADTDTPHARPLPIVPTEFQETAIELLISRYAWLNAALRTEIANLRQQLADSRRREGSSATTAVLEEQIEGLQQELNGGKSQLVYGGTGAGKTVVALETLIRVVRQEDHRCPNVLIVMPSQGQNLPEQWIREAMRQGVPATNIIELSNVKCLGRMRSWMSTPTDCDANGSGPWPRIVITTFHGVHNDVRAGGALSRLLRKDFEFHHMIVDECQFYRNGSNRRKAHEDIDPNAKMYTSITKVRAFHEPRVLVLSATPFYNDRCDVYSLVVLMGLADGKKAAWLRDAERKEWKQQKNWFFDNHVVPIHVPEEVAKHGLLVRQPPTLVSLTKLECELAYATYAKLKALVEWVLRLIGEVPVKEAELEQATKAMLGELVRARRGLLHPVFYDAPVKETRIRRVKGKQQLVETTIPVTEERYRTFKKADASKFNSLVKALAKRSGRVLVTSQFSRPLDFLKLHIEETLPEWKVVVHHGKTNCLRALQDFDRFGVTGNVVMLATAGSVGEGINLAMTTEDGKCAVELLCLDTPLSHAAQQQLEGRIKRPLAQPDVQQWNVGYVVGQAVVPRPSHLPAHAPFNPVHDTIDQALRRVLALKEQSANEIFLSDEELESHMRSTTSYGKKEREGMKSLLIAVWDVCNQWEQSESREHQAARLVERDAQREEKRQRRQARDAAGAEAEAAAAATKIESDESDESDD